jgi:hypothetical protein
MTYYKDGDVKIPERRKDSMEIQQAVLKLISKVEIMESNIELKLESVKDKIQNLDDKMTDKINHINIKFENHCTEASETTELLEQHDRELDKAKSFIDRIVFLESKYTLLDKRVTDLELKPTNSKAQFFDKFIDTFKMVVFAAIASGVIAFVVYLITSYIKSIG